MGFIARIFKSTILRLATEKAKDLAEDIVKRILQETVEEVVTDEKMHAELILKINEMVNLPGMDEEQEAKFIKTIIGTVIQYVSKKI